MKALALLLENLSVGAGADMQSIARVRRDATREITYQVGRAMWRADRRGRWLPLEVRRGAPWVYAQRRKMAHELTRALRSLGATPELTRAIATEACARFPRDGIVITAPTDRPRERGESPRQLGANPRARGDSPRQRGVSPRQKRTAADLSAASSVVQSETLERSSPPVNDLPATHSPIAPGGRVIDAPGWDAMKGKLLEDLAPDERMRARKAAREDRRRLDDRPKRSDRS